MPAITSDLRERARGCLLGAAVGDAFGMALDGQPIQPVTAQVRALRRGRLSEGHFTDHTGSMLAVAEALLEPGSPSGEDLAARVEAACRHAGRGLGRQARGLLAQLWSAEAKPPGGSAAAEATTTADATMLPRALPIALVTLDNHFACAARARDLGRAAYPHPDCAAGGSFVAVVLWHLVHGLAPRQAVQHSLQACTDLPSGLDDTIRWASTRLRDRLTNGPEVQQIVETAVWGLLTTASFAEAVTRVVNLGGNAAAAGLLVGAWAGAAYRHAGIPADWRAQVHGTWPPHGGSTWREAELTQLAERLVLA